MSSKASSHVDYPLTGFRPFQGEPTYRRLARLFHWNNRSRILEVGAADATMYWAELLGCEAVVVAENTQRLEVLSKKVKERGLDEQIEVRQVLYSEMPFGADDFDGIVSLGRPWTSLEGILSTMRGFLARDGRLALVYPVVFFEKSQKQGISSRENALLTPARALAEFHRAGFEPELAECAGASEMQRFLSSIEVDANEDERNGLRPHVELLRQNSLGALSLLGARRKEPNERPPASRDRG